MPESAAGLRAKLPARRKRQKLVRMPKLKSVRLPNVQMPNPSHRHRKNNTEDHSLWKREHSTLLNNNGHNTKADPHQCTDAKEKSGLLPSQRSTARWTCKSVRIEQPKGEGVWQRVLTLRTNWSVHFHGSHILLRESPSFFEVGADVFLGGLIGPRHPVIHFHPFTRRPVLLQKCAEHFLIFRR